MKFYREDKNNYEYWNKIIRNKLNAIYHSESVWFFKSGKHHNFKNASYFNYNGYKEFSLNGKLYGYENDFTKKSWRKFVKIQVFL